MLANVEKRTLLTVITKAVIEQSLLRDLEKQGVRAYTVSDARGRGSRGIRDAAWDEVANIRIEIICQRAQAELLLSHIQDQYYTDYAMVAFMVEIEILRGEKF